MGGAGTGSRRASSQKHMVTSESRHNPAPSGPRADRREGLVPCSTLRSRKAMARGRREVHPLVGRAACALAHALVCQSPSLSGTYLTPVNGRPTQAREAPVLSPGAPNLSRPGEPLWRWFATSVAGSARISGEKAVRSPIPPARGPGQRLRVLPSDGPRPATSIAGRLVLDVTPWPPNHRRLAYGMAAANTTSGRSCDRALSLRK